MCVNTQSSVAWSELILGYLCMKIVYISRPAPGTPTPSTQSSDIAHLQPLLAFLHHEPYGKQISTAWDPAVRIPFEARRPEGRSRLVELLRSCMIRAVKADLLTLPKLVRKNSGCRTRGMGPRYRDKGRGTYRSKLWNRTTVSGMELARRSSPHCP